ncbi:hypothetical protein DFJ73DRAFT_759726 [Zopfochytrium polystomum]|nr:hypothetical protein DFJ73DRAFT_759726 [Zopfochytrium polystomum]
MAADPDALDGVVAAITFLAPLAQPLAAICLATLLSAAFSSSFSSPSSSSLSWWAAFAKPPSNTVLDALTARLRRIRRREDDESAPLISVTHSNSPMWNAETTSTTTTTLATASGLVLDERAPLPAGFDVAFPRPLAAAGICLFAARISALAYAAASGCAPAVADRNHPWAVVGSGLAWASIHILSTLGLVAYSAFTPAEDHVYLSGVPPHIPPLVLLFLATAFGTLSGLVAAPIVSGTGLLIVLADVAATSSLLGLVAYQSSVISDHVGAARDAYYTSKKLPIPSREPSCNVFSYFYFAWMNPMMRQGQRKNLALEDIWDLAESEKAVTAVANFQKWKSSSHHLGLVLLMSQWRSFLYSSAMSIASTLMQVAGPFFLYIWCDRVFLKQAAQHNRIVGSIMDPANSSPMILYVSVCCLPLTVFVKGLLDGQTWHEGVKIGVRLKAVVVNEVYVKSLRRVVTVSAAANKASSDLSVERGSFSAAKSQDEGKAKGDDKEENDATVGRIVTLMSSDAEKIKDSLPYVVDLLSAPVQIIVSILALLQVIGWPALAGLTVMLTTFPATYYLSEWANRVFGRLMDATDRRTNIVNDSLQGIRTIKYFAWERSFLEKIDEARDKEMRCLIDYYLQGATATFAWLFTPILVAFFTLLTITEVAGHQLDARMAFTCISLFYNLRFPMAILPNMIAEVFQLKVAATRISHFLKQDELEKYSALPEEVPLDAPTVGVRSGTFQWFIEEAEATVKPAADASTAPAPSEQTTLLNGMSSNVSSTLATVASFTLRNINLTFPVGGLTSICGPTGAGKSSLIQALLGEMKRLSGRAYLPDPRNPVAIPGTNLTTGTAYVSQTSWLQNSTIRDNILFGEAYDALRYARVIKACALTEDLTTLEAGDLTEIGEKGINLSGGQKQRVSLARAVYSRAAFILLDDPLSSVDAPTARHVFDQAICGLLAGRTRILVTHQTALIAPRADYLVIIRAGEVLFAGTFAGALATLGVDAVLSREDVDASASYSSMQNLLTTKEPAAAEMSNDVAGVPADFSTRKDPDAVQRLVQDEDRSTGAVKLSNYIAYISAAGGLFFLILLISTMIGDRMILFATDYWVKLWAEAYGNGTGVEDPIGAIWWSSGVGASASVDSSRPLEVSFMLRIPMPSLAALTTANDSSAASSTAGDDSERQEVDTWYYIVGYGLISTSWVVVFLSTHVVRCFGSYFASKKFNKALMQNIMFAPIRFFDTTPIGRILNRASKDLSVIDKDVMQSIDFFLTSVIGVIAVALVICSITPLFLGFMVPMMYLYYLVGTRYLATSRELKRLESVTRSPTYSMLSETLTGCSTIRAFGAEQRFIEENLRRVDVNSRAYYFLWCSNRWLGVRISTIAAVTIFAAALIVVQTRDYIGAGFAGLALTWSLSLSQDLVWLIRRHANMEMSMNAVERVNEYLTLPQEAAMIIPTRRPPSSWPSGGAIEVKNLEMRYAPDLPPVLKNVSFSIKAGEKVGIVGRTGAGKSSLLLSIFRIFEPSAGSIVIDGVDVATIGLFDLRSRLTMIPQDPVLFAGTIRSNLDPFNEIEDDRIWRALERVRFLQSLQSTSDVAAASVTLASSSSSSSGASTDGGAALKRPRGSHEATTAVSAPTTGVGNTDGGRAGITLNAVLTEGGSNFSQGQRQLLCLARALLRRSRLTIFDEATASVDNETDALIQETIRGEDFAGTTVLSIAHRLRTIADYDKVLVIEAGEVAALGSPYELMTMDPADGSAIFRKMCEQSGEFEELLAIAKRAEGVADDC